MQRSCLPNWLFSVTVCPTKEIFPLIAAGGGATLPPSEYTDAVATQGRFTNGRNYVDYLSETLNVPIGPSLIGGTNYAVASARTATHFAGNNFSLLGQRDAYLNDLGMNDANPDALHIVWAGANDLNDIITDLFTTIALGDDPMAANATAATAIGQSVANLGEVFTSLAGKNANTILAPNIPNLGIVPLVTTPFGGTPVPAATALAALFNSLLDQELNAVMAAFPLLNIIDFDIFTLSTDIALDPTSFGFANATDACYSLFVEPGGTTCTDPDSYVSWDGFHPTTAAHEVIAARMAVLLVPEPATLTLLLVGLGGLRVARRRQALPA
ncbi:MAG: SGNH/GDSL hydrolase family protein [Proteobacteria bacterium]|nr:SGNH/GDSL hydrolase family protein [Pseudomonadota bacterium]